MKVLTIERSKWRHGGHQGDYAKGETRLLNDQGFMCCLGFDAIACGIEPKRLVGFSSPYFAAEAAAEDGEPLPEGYVATRTAGDRNSAAVREAIKHNDDECLPGTQREALIRKDLIALGWDDVVFVD